MNKMVSEKEMYIDLVCSTIYKDDASMRKYFEKDIAEVLLLSNDRLLEISKPRVHTHFCYSFDEISDAYSGTNTCDDACRHAASGPTKEEFFNHNLKDIENTINHLVSDDLVLIKGYCGRVKNVCSLADKEYTRNLCNTEYSVISKEDFDIILEGYNRVKESFVKRLETYWKKYGNTKLRCWSYSIND